MLVAAVVILLIAGGAVAVAMTHKSKSTPSATQPKPASKTSNAGVTPQVSATPQSSAADAGGAAADSSANQSDPDADLSAEISSALAGAPLPGTTPGSTPTGAPLPVTAGQWRLDGVKVTADPDSGEFEGTFDVTYVGQGDPPSGALFTVGLFVNSKQVGELDGAGSKSSSGNQRTVEVFSSDKYVAGPYSYYFFSG